jgi:hypothetical protein
MDLTNKWQVGAAVVLAVALVGAGTAFAASKLHGHPSTPNASGPRGGFGFQGGPPQVNGRGGGPDLSAAAGYLGISAATLQADLRSGQTLAQIASATSGKSTAGLVAALVKASNGRLTQAQAQALVDAGFGGRPRFGPPPRS